MPNGWMTRVQADRDRSLRRSPGGSACATSAPSPTSVPRLPSGDVQLRRGPEPVSSGRVLPAGRRERRSTPRDGLRTVCAARSRPTGTRRTRGADRDLRLRGLAGRARGSGGDSSQPDRARGGGHRLRGDPPGDAAHAVGGDRRFRDTQRGPFRFAMARFDAAHGGSACTRDDRRRTDGGAQRSGRGGVALEEQCDARAVPPARARPGGAAGGEATRHRYGANRQPAAAQVRRGDPEQGPPWKPMARSEFRTERSNGRFGVSRGHSMSNA